MPKFDISAFPPAVQKQILAKIGEQIQPEKKQQKYHNVKDERGDIKFASRKEARRYDELMLLLKAGKIRNLKLQPEFTLQEAYTTPEGERVRAIRYRADFSYERLEHNAYIDDPGGSYEYIDEWNLVIEDVKSVATKTDKYRMKRKMFNEKYGFKITEI